MATGGDRWSTTPKRPGERPDCAGRLETIHVGDAVVYASHGVGHVTKRGLGRDACNDEVTVQFERGLSVSLPVERALRCLRAPSGEAEIADVQRALRAPAAGVDTVWRTRLKVTKEKVMAGAAVDLAEVIRDGAHRQPSLTARGGLKELSLAERQLYLKARHLLAGELAASRGIDSADADDWISAQLQQAAGWRGPIGPDGAPH